MRVLISGSSGFLGTALRSHLAGTGHEVFPLVRRAARPGERSWDPSTGTVDPVVLDRIEAVVNLSGAGIGDRRLTRRRMHVVEESRVGPTALLAASMAGRPDRPLVFLSQSAVGVYGSRDDEVLTELSPPGSDPLARLVRRWEAAAAPAAAAGIRTVLCRTGLVLAREGGLVVRLLLPFRLGLGGRFGGGGQWWSWIGIEDWCRAMEHLLTTDLDGPVNLTAPEPATNTQFTAALGRALHRPARIPIPRWTLTVALGKARAEALAFGSTRAVPERLAAGGFEFAHPDIDTALGALLAGA